MSNLIGAIVIVQTQSAVWEQSQSPNNSDQIQNQ